MLEHVTIRLPDIQSRLLDILTPQTILVGHSLDSDFKALKMTHPCIVDTSILYPHPRGPPMKSSLKWLAQRYLNREIQKGHGATGHDSIEDAKACLDLVKTKCEKGPAWGTHEASVEPIFKRLRRTPRAGNMRTSSLPNGSSASDHGKSGAIVDHGHPDKGFGQMAHYCIPCTTDDDVIKGIERCTRGDEDSVMIPCGGVDFTWARLRDLDVLCGWRGDNRQSSDLQEPDLRKGVAQTVLRIAQIYKNLPPHTLLVVYSGTGNPREMSRLQERHRVHKREFQAGIKWDDLTEKWTDTEQLALMNASRQARQGIGFLALS